MWQYLSSDLFVLTQNKPGWQAVASWQLVEKASHKRCFFDIAKKKCDMSVKGQENRKDVGIISLNMFAASDALPKK